MKITVGDFALELSIDHGRFLGIGAVHYGSTPLRSPQLPWTCYTESAVSRPLGGIITDDYSH